MVNKKIYKFIVFLFLFAGINTSNVLTTAQAADNPRIIASPEYLVLYAVTGTSATQNQTFTISNGSTGTLNYTLAESTSWFNITPSSGSVTTNKATITVTVNPSGLNPSGSPYIGDIIISNSDNPRDTKKVRVRLVILTEAAFIHSYEYDSRGNITKIITSNGDIVEYTYNAVGKLNHVYYPDGNEVVYTYDAAGNRTAMTDWHGTTDYTYDQWNHLSGVGYPGVSFIYYNYDRSGKLTKITYPDQTTVTYGFDTDGRLTTVISSSGTTTLEYDNTTNHLKKKTLPNGVYTNYTYDLTKRVTDVANKKSNGSLISSYHYVYDANSNITQETEVTASGTTTKNYAYDKLNRLTRADYSDGTFEAYTYDAMGNRLTMTTGTGTITYEYDFDNRLIRANDIYFFYDKNGNLIKKISPQKIELYQYDYNNMLIQYSNGTDTVQYEYDGDRNRIAKIVNGLRTNYINDINRPIIQVLMEADANMKLTKKYIYGIDLISQEEF